LLKFLNISRYTANKLCREGRIKAIKVGSDWKVTKEALEKYLKIKK
jgi:excisionase family DNA binding protein